MTVFSGLTIPPAQVLNAVGSAASILRLAVSADRAVVPLTYGEDRVAGLLQNIVLSASNPKLLLVQVIWGWGCDGISEILLGDQALPTGTTITNYTGAQTTPDAQIAAALAAQGYYDPPALTGFAYSVIAIPIKAINGQLNITAKIRGRRVYDPRKDGTRPGGSGAQRLADPSTWAWSDVPALAQADWTANSAYGAGLAVDWDSVAILANANESLVAGERRRIIGLTLREAAEVKAVAEALRAYSGSWAVATASGVKFVPDANAAPVASYSHFDGSVISMSALQLSDTSRMPTAVEVIYTDTRTMPWRDASAIATVPGAGTTKPWRLSQVRLPGIKRYSQAKREATERLNKLNLTAISTAVDVPDTGIRHEVGDIVSLTLQMGITAKPFRVVDVTMSGPGRWRLDVQEHDPAAYSDSVQSAPGLPNTSLNSPAGPPDQVQGIGLEVVLGGLRITRSLSTELDIAYTEYQYSVDGGSTWQAIKDPADRQGCVWSNPPLGLVRVRARDVDDQGLPGPWSPATSVTIGSAVFGGLALGAINRDPSVATSAAWELPSGVTISAGPSGAAGAVGSAYMECFGGVDRVAWDAARYPLDPSAVYNFSANLYADAGNNRNMYLVVDMFDAAGARVAAGWGGTYSGYTFGGLPTPGKWTRYGADFGAGTARPIPSNAVSCRIGVWFQYSSGSSAVQQAAQDIRLVDMRSAWAGIDGRPKTFAVRARGNSATTLPPGWWNGLRNAETNAELGGVGHMYSVARLSRAGELVGAVQTFNPYSGGATAAGAMAAHLNAIPNGDIVVVWTFDEPRDNRTSGNLPAAMYRCGASRAVFGSSQFQFRAAYILVGVAGSGEGMGAEVYSGAIDSDPNAWCELAFQIQNGVLTVSGANGGARSLYDLGPVQTDNIALNAATSIYASSQGGLNLVSGSNGQFGAELAQLTLPEAGTYELTATLAGNVVSASSPSTSFHGIGFYYAQSGGMTFAPMNGVVDNWPPNVAGGTFSWVLPATATTTGPVTIWLQVVGGGQFGDSINVRIEGASIRATQIKR